MAEDYFRVLSLDGGGAKGFYTIGVLRQIEALTGKRLCEVFDLIFGTSTGSIIAALLALGHSTEEIHALYEEHVVKIMKRVLPSNKSAALAELADLVFQKQGFDAFKTDVGIVTTKWIEERPMIFKTDVKQAYSSQASFVPGFGATISDAVQASCSAYPFFSRKSVKTTTNGSFLLADGGYCANNPTLYAVADATGSLAVDPARLRVVSIGVGEYPAAKRWKSAVWWLTNWWPSLRLLQKTMEINTQSMEQLREVLFGNIQAVRINEAYTSPELATDLFEHDKRKLDLLHQRGTQSYRLYEPKLKEFLL